MEIGKVVFQKLFDCYDLTQIVGDKIFPLAMGEDRVYPAIIYSIQGNPISSKDPLSVSNCKVQIDAYAYTYEQVRTIAALIYGELRQYNYTMHDVTVLWSEVENDADGFDAEMKLFHVQQDYKIIFQW